MFNNLYEKIKKFIKENFKTIIFFIILYIVFMYPLNYYIITGGGIMKVGNRIQVVDSYKEKGNFNLAYVSEAKGTIATYLLSYIMPDWKRIKVSDYTFDKNESVEDVEFRSKIDLMNANDYAIKNAYLEANKEYNIIDTSLYVYYVLKGKDNGFQVGDKILRVEGMGVNTTDDYRKIINQYKKDDTVLITILRDNKEKNIKVKLYEEDGKLLSGILVSSINTYKTKPIVKIKFKSKESGPSGGLITTLDIYNKLTKRDLTHGLVIAGTGEIEEDGKISTIGGVKYKLLGASRANADIFLVPNGENYKECMKIAKKRKLKIKIIGVSTFKEAIQKLEKVK